LKQFTIKDAQSASICNDDGRPMSEPVAKDQASSQQWQFDQEIRQEGHLNKGQKVQEWHCEQASRQTG
jgi:hypothetical protein